MGDLAPVPAHGLLDDLQHGIRPQDFAWAAASVIMVCAYEMRLGSALLTGAVYPLLVLGRRWQPSHLADADGRVAQDCDEPLTDPPAAAAVLDYRHDMAAVRRFAGGQARLAGLDPGRIPDLVLAVNELATNTLTHTSGPGTVVMWKAGGEIICQVHDGGQITSAQAGSMRPHPGAAEQGWGRWLVRQVCDLVETWTGPGGTTTRLHMRLA